MKIIKKLLLLLLIWVILTPTLNYVKAENQINVYLFYSDTCPHCADMETYLDNLDDKYSNITVISYEVHHTGDALLYSKVINTFNLDAYVPVVIIGGISFVGFNSQITKEIESTIIRYSSEEFVDVVNKIINDETILPADFDSLDRYTLQLPLIGEVQVESVSIFLVAVVLGLVDGFNPCAMWVLLFLITMLIEMKDKKRMWIIGGTFLFTSAFIYFLIMVSWLQLASSLIALTWIRYLIGIFAITFGVYNLFKYFKSRNEDIGCTVTTESKRTKTINKIKNITKNRNLILALFGVIGLAITVNMFELACSAGLPLLFTQILAYNQLGTGEYFFYILVYILFFLIDDIIIFVIAMITMQVTGISNKYSRYSTIIGGIIMFIIGFLLVFFPNIIMFNI